MDQEKGGGHPLITYLAVKKLFAEKAVDGKILGSSEQQLYETLNKWQGYADRSPAGFAENTPTGGGDTYLWSGMVPDSQRAHAMADPKKSGAENLRDIKAYIAGNLYVAKVAHDAGNTELEGKSLGAAVHALEDSFSSAHAFRDANNQTDPHAAIEALNNFSPGSKHQTHDKSFDKVPHVGDKLGRGTDQAARDAVAELLGSYVSHVNDKTSDAYKAYQKAVEPFFQGKDVKVFTDKKDPEYLKQRERHYQNETSTKEDSYKQPATEDKPNMTPTDSNMTDEKNQPVHIEPSPENTKVTDKLGSETDPFKTQSTDEDAAFADQCQPQVEAQDRTTDTKASTETSKVDQSSVSADAAFGSQLQSDQRSESSAETNKQDEPLESVATENQSQSSDSGNGPGF